MNEYLIHSLYTKETPWGAQLRHYLWQHIVKRMSTMQIKEPGYLYVYKLEDGQASGQFFP